MSITVQIREGAAYVAEHADYVSINYDLIQDYATGLDLADKYKTPLWDNYHLQTDDPEALAAYVLILDSINFGSGFFGNLKKLPHTNSGYVTIATYLKDFFEQVHPYCDNFAEIAGGDCAEIFNQDYSDPVIGKLMDMYAMAIREISGFVLNRFSGSFSDFVLKANCSVSPLAEGLGSLKMFHDVADYKGQVIPVYKRAQIAVADLYCAFGGQGIGRFDDLENLTIYADNVVPHVLRIDGILNYHEGLAKRIDAGYELKPGTAAEVELRCCAIHAAELIVKAMRKQGQDVITMYLDHYWWDIGHDDKYRKHPSHKTLTCFY